MKKTGFTRIGKVAKIGLKGPTRAYKPDVGGGRAAGAALQMNLVPEELRVWARVVGETRAREVWDLTQKGIVGTLPELCTYVWLEKRKIEFEFQSHQMGGRSGAGGGAVVDFVLYNLSSNGYYCWRIQGEYWHTFAPEVVAKDQAQADRLRQLKIGGVPVVGVVDLWETDVYQRYPAVFESAEMGVGLRG